MKISVLMTKSVEVHAHNFEVVVTLGSDENSAPRLSLACRLCGNSFSIPGNPTYVYGAWTENRVSLATLLEIAAEEQDKRHKDWLEEA